MRDGLLRERLIAVAHGIPPCPDARAHRCAPYSAGILPRSRPSAGAGSSGPARAERRRRTRTNPLRRRRSRDRATQRGGGVRNSVRLMPRGSMFDRWREARTDRAARPAARRNARASASSGSSPRSSSRVRSLSANAIWTASAVESAGNSVCSNVPSSRTSPHQMTATGGSGVPTMSASTSCWCSTLSSSDVAFRRYLCLGREEASVIVGSHCLVLR